MNTHNECKNVTQNNRVTDVASRDMWLRTKAASIHTSSTAVETEIIPSRAADMTIHVCVKTKLSNGKILVSEDHYLDIGQYNEFYIPALTDPNRKTEMWVTVTDDYGIETKLHLKR